MCGKKILITLVTTALAVVASPPPTQAPCEPPLADAVERLRNELTELVAPPMWSR